MPAISADMLRVVITGAGAENWLEAPALGSGGAERSEGYLMKLKSTGRRVVGMGIKLVWAVL